MPKSLSKYLLLSVGFHTLFLLWMVLAPSFLSQEAEKDTQVYKVTMIELSLGDGGKSLKAGLPNTKSLPKSTIAEQRKAKRLKTNAKKGTDLAENKAKTKETVVQKYNQKRTAENAGLKIKKDTKKKKPLTKKKNRISDALARIDTDLQQRQVELKSAQSKAGKTGQSLDGGARGSKIDPALATYYSAVKRRIQREWILSKGEFSGGLIARVIVKINSSGAIIRHRIRKSSGDGSFDASAVRAVKRASPLPRPPASIRNEAIQEGFEFVFNPRSVTGRI